MSMYIIGYDIRNPKRLQRVHRAMLRHAVAIEYSIFILEGTEKAKDICLEEISSIINEKVDDVRCYPLPSRGLQVRLGKSVMPEGISWTGLPVSWA